MCLCLCFEERESAGGSVDEGTRGKVEWHWDWGWAFLGGNLKRFFFVVVCVWLGGVLGRIDSTRTTHFACGASTFVEAEARESLGSRRCVVESMAVAASCTDCLVFAFLMVDNTHMPFVIFFPGILFRENFMSTFLHNSIDLPSYPILFLPPTIPTTPTSRTRPPSALPHRRRVVAAERRGRQGGR